MIYIEKKAAEPVSIFVFLLCFSSTSRLFMAVCFVQAGALDSVDFLQVFRELVTAAGASAGRAPGCWQGELRRSQEQKSENDDMESFLSPSNLLPHSEL